MIDDVEREQLEDPWVGPTVYIGIVGILATVVAIILVHAIYYGVEVTVEEAQRLDAPIVEAKEAKEQQQQWVQQFRWTDKEKGLVGIPIDEAMRMVIDEERRKP